MILSAGLSPAWQQILLFDGFTLGRVNRAAESHWCASGKVLNVGRAVTALGGDGHIVCSVGGPSGARIREEFSKDDAPSTWIETTAESRVCTTLIDRSSHPPAVTEMVANASAITTEELATFEQAVRDQLSRVRMVVFTGSLPEVGGVGRPIELWASLLPHAPAAILDIRGPELIAALPQRPRLVKPNRSELEATVGRSLRTDHDVIAAMRELNNAGAEWVLTSDGGRPACLTNGDDVWQLTPPTSKVVNPIGCGDCLTAGIAVFLDSEEVMRTAGSRSMPDVVLAARFGMAAAAVNLADVRPARLTLEGTEQRLQDVTLDRL